MNVTDQPLVSVGIPTYNRPEGLRRTLECITKQTYRNLEIIVSDNCTEGENGEYVARIIKEFAEGDSRITFFRQSNNIGGKNNFEFLFNKSKADFFFWASDDDLYHVDFVRKMMDILCSNYQIVAACAETQYTLGGERLSFFREGEAFYSCDISSPIERCKHLFKHWYGNQIYSIFRADIIRRLGFFPVFDWVHPFETVFLFFLARHGRLRTSPEVLFFKEVHGEYDFAHLKILHSSQHSLFPFTYTNSVSEAKRFMRQLYWGTVEHLLVTQKTVNLSDFSEEEKNELLRIAHARAAWYVSKLLPFSDDSFYTIENKQRLEHFFSELCDDNQIKEKLQSNSELQQFFLSAVIVRIIKKFGRFLIALKSVSLYKKYYKMKEFLFARDSEVLSDLDIVIPVTPKDYKVLPYTIDFAVKNIKHNINTIFIVLPDGVDEPYIERSVVNICFVREAQLDISRHNIPRIVVNGLDRTGWLIQQLIKLSSDEIVSKEKFLVLDADTLLVKKQSFEHNGRDVLLFSDEHHMPYYSAFEKLFGYTTHDSISCVTHHMLLEKKYLIAMKNEIMTRHDCHWVDAIIRSMDTESVSFFSEYETYGHWMLRNNRNSVVREYFYNRAMPQSAIEKDDFMNGVHQLTKSISLHSYI